MTDPRQTGAATTRRGPGRPRVDGHDTAVLAATLGLIDAGEQITLNRVVEISGVSRAALYRRWPSLTELIADALDQGRDNAPVPVGSGSPEEFVDALFGEADDVGRSYPEARFRRRIQLVMADRALQRKYWEAHVAKRRVTMRAALQAGVDAGRLRDDLDLDACCDLIAGVFYYQIVVRGDSIGDAATRERCRRAVEVALTGMSGSRG